MPVSVSIPLLYGFQCCMDSDPAGNGLFQSEDISLLYSTSRLLAVIFISPYICTGSFNVKMFAQGQEPNLPLLCHFIVYTSRRLYAIPHAMSVTLSLIMLYM